MDEFSKEFANQYAASNSGQSFVMAHPITGEIMEGVGEAPLKWGEYPEGVEPGTNESYQYDVNRRLFRPFPHEILEANSIAQTVEMPEGSQITDPNWQIASRIMYEYTQPKRRRAGPMRFKAASQQNVSDLSGEEMAHWGVKFMSSFENNIPAMVLNVAKLQDAPPEVTRAMYYMLETSDREGVLMSNVWRGLGNIAVDPSTWVGLATLGIGLAGRETGKQVSKMAFKELLRDAVTKQSVKSSTLAVAGESAFYGAVDNLARQEVAIEAGQQQGIDVGQLATTAGVSGALGQAVGTVAGPQGAELLKRGAGAVVDRLNQPGQMPDVGMNAGQLFQSAEPVKIDADEAVNILNIRADQMKLAPKDRTQPSGEVMFDTTPEAYARTFPEQKETPVPRAPEGKPLPLGDRARKVIDMSEAIADKLAERAKPYVGTNVQFFYNTGPIVDKAVELGYTKEQAFEALRKFALNYAATSPRTKTEENLRSASIAGVKQERGIDIGTIIGPGGEGINEKGYPMIIGIKGELDSKGKPNKSDGIHRQLLDAVAAEGISFDTNPKPATFAENVAGNLAGVTVDTHAIRAVFDVLNELEPGSIPLKFIGGKTAAKTKEYQEMYQNDPTSFDAASMVADTLQSQKIDGKDVQTEYAVFSDIYKMVAEKLGVKPAEAQSLSWFANGDKTGLASEPKTIVELIDDRVDVTAQLTGMSKDEVFAKFFKGSIPLLSLGGGVTLLETGASMSDNEGDGT